MNFQATLLAFSLSAVGTGCVAEHADDAGGEDRSAEAVSGVDAYCPTGASYSAASRLCIAGVDAIGPFSATMEGLCVKAGGGATTCAGARWNAKFAASIRGAGTCQPGTTFDSGLGVCADATQAFGPFSKSMVARCKAAGGGTSCETMRWAKGMVMADVGGGSISAKGRDQMRRLVAYADSHNSGASRGRCFEYVWNYLSSSGYGLIDDYNDASDMPSAYARNFAEYMNSGGNAARWGLQRLSIDNPYDAPVGAVVVVAAGSPGTSHPTAGDIAIYAGGNRFINDGPNMGYGPRASFKSSGGRVLGVYVPQ